MPWYRPRRGQRRSITPKLLGTALACEPLIALRLLNSCLALGTSELAPNELPWLPFLVSGCQPHTSAQAHGVGLAFLLGGVLLALSGRRKVSAGAVGMVQPQGSFDRELVEKYGRGKGA